MALYEIVDEEGNKADDSQYDTLYQAAEAAADNPGSLPRKVEEKHQH